jgi:hypothetical protein
MRAAPEEIAPVHDALPTILEPSTVERLATGFGFTGGPPWHPNGFLYRVDSRQSQLLRSQPGTGVENAARACVIASPARRMYGYHYEIRRSSPGTRGCLMGMCGQAVVGMRWDLMIMLARLIHRVDVHRDPAEHVNPVEELMAHFFGNGMSLSDRQGRCDRNTQFSMQPIAYPAGLYLRDSLHTRDMPGDMPELGEDLGIDPIHRADDYHPAGLPDEP